MRTSALRILSVSFLLFLPACGPASSNAEISPETHTQHQSSPAEPESVGGLGGSVSGLALDCVAARTPEGGNCTPTDQGSTCQSCVAARCCSEQTACNALQPMNSCAFGSTLFQGSAVTGGEIACVMECLADRTSRGTFSGQASDVDQCADQCAASECGSQRASTVTRDLAVCIVGDATQGDPGCRSECGLLL